MTSITTPSMIEKILDELNLCPTERLIGVFNFTFPDQLVTLDMVRDPNRFGYYRKLTDYIANEHYQLWVDSVEKFAETDFEETIDLEEAFNWLWDRQEFHLIRFLTNPYMTGHAEQALRVYYRREEEEVSLQDVWSEN